MITHRTARKITRALLHSDNANANAERPAIALEQCQADDGPMSLMQAANARRDAEYLARRNGLKEPLLQLWKFN